MYSSLSVGTSLKLNSTAPSLHGHYPFLRYYEQFRPCSWRRYSHAYAAQQHLRFSLCIQSQVLTFHTKAQTEIMPPLCRMPHGQSAHSRHAFPEDHVQTSVLTSSSNFRHLLGDLRTFIFSAYTDHLTFTTMPFEHSSSRLFGTYSCKPMPRGLPSSLVQLRDTRT